MGEAIALFREMALAMRCHSDAALIAPADVFLGLDHLRAARLSAQIEAGRMPASDFARLLRATAGAAGGSKGSPPPPDGTSRAGDFNKWFNLNYRNKIVAKAPGRRDFDKQYAKALGDAAKYEDVVAIITKRLDTLHVETLSLRDVALDPWRSSYSRVKAEYVRLRKRWQHAFDALAPFADEPPADKGSSPGKQTRRRDLKGIGGRKKKYPARLRQQIIKDRRREERKKKPQPLKEWLTVWATTNDLKRSEAANMYKAEQAAIRRARCR